MLDCSIARNNLSGLIGLHVLIIRYQLSLF